MKMKRSIPLHGTRVHRWLALGGIA